MRYRPSGRAAADCKSVPSGELVRIQHDAPNSKECIQQTKIIQTFYLEK